MEIDMILHIALKQEVVEAKKCVVGLGYGCDEGIVTLLAAVTTGRRVEDKSVQLERHQDGPLEHRFCFGGHDACICG